MAREVNFMTGERPAQLSIGRSSSMTCFLQASSFIKHALP